MVVTTGVETLTFGGAAAGGDFEAYRHLYAVGTSVDRTDSPFHAHVRIRRFQRMILFERSLGGVHHVRTTDRVRRDGFDHITLHLLVGGSLSGGPLGLEHRLQPGEIMLIDTSRPHWNLIDRARLVSVQLAREVAETATGLVEGLHGAVLPEGAAGLLADFLTSLVRRADTLPAAAIERAALTVAELLGLALNIRTTEPVARLLSIEAARPLRRIRAEAYIDAHLSDPQLDADAVGAGIGTSRSALYQAFSDAGGIARYIQSRRLERLRNALRRSGETRPVSALAFACGFVSESQCNRAFRTAFGVPPGRYRADIDHVRRLRLPAAEISTAFAHWTSELY